MSSLRVIAGAARGRRLRSVPGDSTRPITDRAKESLFNIIGYDIIDSSFLDLFAGTGSVGIEALSRGAAFVRFVDKNRQAYKTVQSNLKYTGLEQGSEVLHKDAFTLLESPVDHKFDYIFIAPPQYKNLWERALIGIDDHPDWLAGDAWVIAQIHPVEYKDLALNTISEFDQRKYGSVLLIFYS